MAPPVIAGDVRLTCVLCDGQATHFLAACPRRAAGEVAVLSELQASGHADLAFDLLCEMIRKRYRRLVGN